MGSKRVLVTGAGQIALTIARSLDRNNISTDIINCSPRFHPAIYSRHVEKVYSAEKENIISEIKSATEEKEYDLLIPGDPYTVENIVKNREKLQKNVRVAAPEDKVFQTAYDKAKTAKYCEKADVPTPETAEKEIGKLGENPRMNYPFVLKHVNSLGGEGVDLIENKSNWEEKREAYTDKYGENERAVLQDYKPGEMSCTNVLCREGEVLAVCQVDRIRELKMGTSSYRKTVPVEDKLRKHTESLMQEMNWTGVAQLQFQKQGDNYYLIEVNGRFWTPLPTAVNAGINFPLELYRMYTEKPESYQKEYISGVHNRNLLREAEILSSGKKILTPYSTVKKVREVSKRTLNGSEKIDEATARDPLPGIYLAYYFLKEVTRKKPYFLAYNLTGSTNKTDSRPLKTDSIFEEV